MVGQIGADTRQIVDDVDADRLQVRTRTNARDLQQMRRVDGAARQDHLARGHHLAIPALLAEGDTYAALAFEQQPGGKRLGLDAQVRPASRLRQKRACGRAAEAAIARHLRIADALVLAAVEVVGQRKAGLLRGVDEPMGQVQGRAVVLDQDGAALAALLGLARRIALDRLEIGQHLVERPALAAHLRPAVVVGRVAADPEHAVDRARAAEHAPARPVHLPAGDAGLGIGGVVPVDPRVVEQLQDARRHVDHRVPVFRAGLEQHDPRAVFAQAIGQHAAGRAGAHHHIVCLHVVRSAGHALFRPTRRRRWCSSWVPTTSGGISLSREAPAGMRFRCRNRRHKPIGWPHEQETTGGRRWSRTRRTSNG